MSLVFFQEHVWSLVRQFFNTKRVGMPNFSGFRATWKIAAKYIQYALIIRSPSIALLVCQAEVKYWQFPYHPFLISDSETLACQGLPGRRPSGETKCSSLFALGIPSLEEERKNGYTGSYNASNVRTADELLEQDLDHRSIWFQTKGTN